MMGILSQGADVGRKMRERFLKNDGHPKAADAETFLVYKQSCIGWSMRLVSFMSRRVGIIGTVAIHADLRAFYRKRESPEAAAFAVFRARRVALCRR